LDVKLPVIYMLDTNTVAYIVDGRSKTARLRLAEVPQRISVVISAITEAEIRYGLAKKPAAIRLREAMEEFLSRITVLPWNSDAARTYGTMRASLSTQGKTLSSMDLLIAAHAASVKATLVTSDRAFQHAEGLYSIVDWASDLKVK
jgi:tRNA(fMet)-specific endonuclease VapC